MTHLKNPPGFLRWAKIVRHSGMTQILRICATQPLPTRGLSAQIRRIHAKPASRLELRPEPSRLGPSQSSSLPSQPSAASSQPSAGSDQGLAPKARPGQGPSLFSSLLSSDPKDLQSGSDHPTRPGPRIRADPGRRSQVPADPGPARSRSEGLTNARNDSRLIPELSDFFHWAHVCTQKNQRKWPGSQSPR